MKTLEHARVLADAAHKVAESHRIGREQFPRHLTGIPSSFACQIKDHLSCLLVDCRCGCHKGEA